MAWVAAMMAALMCPQCGHMLKACAKYCPNCGGEVQKFSENTTAALIILVIITVFFVFLPLLLIF